MKSNNLAYFRVLWTGKAQNFSQSWKEKGCKITIKKEIILITSSSQVFLLNTSKPQSFLRRGIFSPKQKTKCFFCITENFSLYYDSSSLVQLHYSAAGFPADTVVVGMVGKLRQGDKKKIISVWECKQIQSNCIIIVWLLRKCCLPWVSFLFLGFCLSGN